MNSQVFNQQADGHQIISQPDKFDRQAYSYACCSCYNRLGERIKSSMNCPSELFLQLPVQGDRIPGLSIVQHQVRILFAVYRCYL